MAKRFVGTVAILLLVVLSGCAHKKSAIPGAPGARGIEKDRRSPERLPGDETIKNPEVAYNMALEFAGQKNMEAAHHYIALASHLKPMAKYSFTNALFYLAEGRYNEALGYLQYAMKLGPGSSENKVAVLNAMGVCNMELGNDEKALELFRQVVNTQGMMSRYESYYNMGVIYLRQKKLLDAQAVFMKVVEENPRFYKGYNKLGVIAAAKGDWGSAALSFKKAIDLIKGDYKAIQNVGAEIYYNYGEALFRQKLYPQARTALLEVLKIAPEGTYGTSAKALLAQIEGAG